MPDPSLKMVWLGTAYLPPVQYFCHWLNSHARTIEQFDHYQKQTYRNRCKILGSNGIISLTVPVKRGSNRKTYVRDIRIEYAKDWQKDHWKGITSAYRHSPFFEFYQDELEVFYRQHHEFLLDFNGKILDFLLPALELDHSYSYSQAFLPDPPEGVVDMRERIHPKRDVRTDPSFQSAAYPQVFSERHGFQPNLSVIDLLFNEGPNARNILQKSIKIPAGKNS
jgi:hypothetical protein